MKEAVYFYDSRNIRRLGAFGQLIEMAFACYFRGKELGYKDIYIEWHDMNSYLWFNNKYYGGIKCPKNTVLDMMTFVEKGSIVPNADKIDISEKDSLYDGCLPLISREHLGAVMSCCYLNKYYYDYNAPFIELEPKPKNKFILFHYRHSYQDRQLKRNISDKIFLDMAMTLKKKYGDKYKYWKIGEKFEHDNVFDRVYPYFSENIDKIFKLIRDCSLYVGSPSGPHSIAMVFHKPMFMVISDKLIESSIFEYGWKLTEDVYKNRYGDEFKVIGKTGYDYRDKDIQPYIYEREYTSNRLLEFSKNILG